LRLTCTQHEQTAQALVHSFNPATSLEKEIASILSTSDAVEKPGQKSIKSEEPVIAGEVLERGGGGGGGY
jgi:hypothetical protein